MASIAEISQETSLPASLFGVGAVTEDVSGLFYLINGILCLFVVEAVRRPTVVSVWIPLRRATALGLLLSVPAFFIHEELNTINEATQLPEWAWVLVASVLVFAISRARVSTELVDRLFDRDFHRARQQLAAAGLKIQHADSLAEIERLLVEEPVRSLRLASAALFREEAGVFRRRASAGWEAANTDTLARAVPCWPENSMATLSRSMELAASTLRSRFRTIWPDPFSASRWAIRGAASRSGCTAAT